MKRKRIDRTSDLTKCANGNKNFRSPENGFTCKEVASQSLKNDKKYERKYKGNLPSVETLSQ